MNDILPEQVKLWQWVESALREIATYYGYQELRFPIVESLALFKRTIGEVTDIVEKEMYAFPDRNGDMLALRPEGTAGCVRAGIEHGLFYNQLQKLYYLGPMFRHERPQKGRYRQFFHFGAEAFGYADADIDAELILMTARLWRKLNIDTHVSLQLNSLGSSAARVSYREALVQYYNQHTDKLDEECLLRLKTNPLRILDSKDENIKKLNQDAPKLTDYLDEDSKQHFAKLRRLLDKAGLSYTINPQLVRGLDYYNGTVFEWITTSLGAQGTVCGGGRYDTLVEQLGGKSTPAIGLAIGLERLILLIQEFAMPDISTNMDLFIVAAGEEAQYAAFALAEQLRDQVPDLLVGMNLSGGNLKAQLKRADKSGASLAVIIGENELENKSLLIKYLREDKPQAILKTDEFSGFITQLFSAL
ncbi:MAG: histidine--tRNA ligase [Legionellales bacterium]|nr:histidine--tRNA ligase [Legionellales bacterium]